MHTDLTLLPPDLVRQSLSTRDIVLALPDALRAVDHLLASGRRLEAWEGWVRLPDGGRTRSLAHAGSFALPMDPTQAAETARRAMERAQQAFERTPEYPGSALFFCLTVAPE